MATLYRFFDDEGTLLYIGITEAPLVRLDGHAAVQPWWHLVASAKYEHFPTREIAREAEVQAIRAEGPAFNVADNGDPRLSERLAAWDARMQRRALAAARAFHGDDDHRLPPYETACPLEYCAALEYEPCRGPSGNMKSEPHSVRVRASWTARHCPACGGPPARS
ncbi:GIY-YIG nuclease family protein [Nonomuraea sp. PA05]|uniref:GIY-YIG nuclease family protein n=1 Tax=Nonomuraea sp. PA05 TaxID=2604466 RepID=UPI0011D9CB98|nr:GIY-YIG nuclease family protein [Nonomuraea sp. PA05]TYB69785.1 GIY-YIG nuclease family protein [Nonomuraea sp. PA05]